jgi:hypothetical protein
MVKVRVADKGVSLSKNTLKLKCNATSEGYVVFFSPRIEQQAISYSEKFPSSPCLQRPAILPYLSQMNAVHIPPPYFFNIHT